MTERPRFDGLGIAILGLVAFLLIGLAVTGFIRAPEPVDDSTVQQSMAWASWAMVVVSIVGGAIGALSLYLIFRTLQAAQRSALAAEASVSEARSIGRAQTRAYLSIEAAAIMTKHNLFSLEITYRNAGQSPALQVSVRVEIDMDDPLEFEPVIFSHTVFGRNLPDLVAGGTTTRVIRNLDFDPTDILDSNDTSADTFRAHVTIRLTYKDVFGTTNTAEAGFTHWFDHAWKEKERIAIDALN